MEPAPVREIDLHGLGVDPALRRVRQELHAARVQGSERLVLVTGAGWGNREQKPVLREALERWLRTPEARALGVREVTRVHRGGALELRLGSARR
jgi:DNA-nicking Smr family endonuclease